MAYFSSHECICLADFLMVVQVFVSDRSIIKEPIVVHCMAEFPYFI